MDPKWRIVSLSLMAITLILLVAATMTTNWRKDHESRIDVFITHGLWRICRDIKFGATLDHQCMASLANEAPGLSCSPLLFVKSNLIPRYSELLLFINAMENFAFRKPVDIDKVICKGSLAGRLKITLKFTLRSW